MKLWHMLRNKMSEHSTQLIEENDLSLTYEAYISCVESLSKRIANQKCCAIYCESEFIASIVILSCFSVGVTAVPLSPRYGRKHCEKILRKISPSCVVSDMNGSVEIYSIVDSEYIEPKEKPAVIMCTSGTSGYPKAAMLSENNILSNLHDISDYFSIDFTDTILISRPLYHCAVLTGEFLVSLMKGLHIVFYSEAFDPKKISEIIGQKKATVFCATPTILNALSHFGNNAYLKNLKHITISGECMNKTIGTRILNCFSQAHIYHVYGLTEASPRVSYMPSEHFDEHINYVGIPLKSVNVEIRDDSNKPIKDGTAGRLYIKGSNVMMGYYNDSDLTKSVLIDGWLYTGDIAIQENGYLRILGRNDDLIIRAGMNIYPTEIEGELKKDKRVKDVFVYGQDHPKRGTLIGLDIVGVFRSITEIKEMCIQRLSKYQVPDIINLVDELPKNAAGKIIRKANEYAGI